MANEEHKLRYKRLLLWMYERDITFFSLAEKLGVSDGCVRSACQGEYCPTRHHEKMIALGIPAELLPDPRDLKRGPKPKVPCWPNLEQTGA